MEDINLCNSNIQSVFICPLGHQTIRTCIRSSCPYSSSTAYIFCHFYAGSVFLISCLHMASFCVSSPVSPYLHIHPYVLRASLTSHPLHIHPRHTFPHVLFILSHDLPVPLYPSIFNLRDISPTFIAHLIPSVLSLLIFVARQLHLNTHISGTSNFFFCAFVAGDILKQQFLSLQMYISVVITIETQLFCVLSADLQPSLLQ